MLINYYVILQLKNPTLSKAACIKVPNRVVILSIFSYVRYGMSLFVSKDFVSY